MLTRVIIKSGFVSFKYAFIVFIFPITLKLLDYQISPQVRLFKILKKKREMEIHFRRTSKDFPHQGLAETCLLRSVPCLEALLNTVQPSARRDLWERGEKGAGVSCVRLDPFPPGPLRTPNFLLL